MRRISARTLPDAVELAGVAALLEVAGHERDLALDHGERVVDLVREADRHFAEHRELVASLQLGHVLREADRALLLVVLVVEDHAGDRDVELVAVLRDERRREVHDPAGAAVLGAAHGGHHAARFVERRVELDHVAPDDLEARVAEVLPRTVVVVLDHAIGVGRDDDVGRNLDQTLEDLLIQHRTEF